MCYNAVINRIYENPPLDTSVLDCIAAGRRLPCSLCAARNNISLTFSAPALPPGVELPLFVHPPAVDPITTLDKKLRLKKTEREHAESVLKEFGETVRRTERKLGAHQHRPKSSFFPTSVIRSVLNVLLTLDSLEKLEAIIASWVFATGYRVRLYAVIHTLRTNIVLQRETARLVSNAKQRASRQKKKTRRSSESEDEVEEEDVKFSIEELAELYQEEDLFLWYLTECFSASRKNGAVIVKKTRPHSMVRASFLITFVHLKSFLIADSSGRN